MDATSPRTPGGGRPVVAISGSAPSLPDPSVAALLDALDRRDQSKPLDPVAFLNEHCHDHLPLEALQTALSERLQQQDDILNQALSNQSETAATTRAAVHDAQAAVLALAQRLERIQSQATQCERTVREITVDLALLDGAQKRLQATIATQKRLHMVVHAAEQLRQLRNGTDYGPAAHLVHALQLLLQHFEKYLQAPTPLRVLAQQVQAHQNLLKQGAMEGLQGAVRGESTMTTAEREGGVLLLDALGVGVSFQTDLCADYLKTYAEQFAPPEPKKPEPVKRISSFKKQEEPVTPVASTSHKLVSLEERFKWFRDLVQQSNVPPTEFPVHWNFHATLTTLFLRMTRDHILILLEPGPRKDADATNATVLLKALQTTVLFERDSTAWLQREYGTKFENDKVAPKDEDESESEEEKKRPIVKPLIGMASTAFESHMTPYIALEEQSMDEQLAEALEDRTVDTRGERPVFISSTNLFVYIKGSITRCTVLTKGSAFFLLYQAFQDSLKKYAQILNGKLPSPKSAGTPGLGGLSIPNSFGGKQDSNSYKLPNGEEVTVCHVITTCEYCADTTEALEDLIRDTVDDEYKERIDMTAQQEVFHDTTAKAIQVLVSGLSDRAETAFKTPLSAVNWATFQAVGEESPYVAIIHKELQPAVIQIRSLLPTSYFRSFCDKLATMFSNLYYDALIKLKRISEPGTQQLLLDVYNLKTLFLKLPILEEKKSLGSKATASGKSTIAPAMYTKQVQKLFGRIETMLKLVGTPTDLLLENFRVQWRDGTGADMQTILNLKGVPRKEQIAILEGYGGGSAKTNVAANAMSDLAANVQGSLSMIQSPDVNQTLDGFRQTVAGLRKTIR